VSRAQDSYQVTSLHHWLSRSIDYEKARQNHDRGILMEEETGCSAFRLRFDLASRSDSITRRKARGWPRSSELISASLSSGDFEVSLVECLPMEQT
jgi:hypothetical protein